MNITCALSDNQIEKLYANVYGKMNNTLVPKSKSLFDKINKVRSNIAEAQITNPDAVADLQNLLSQLREQEREQDRPLHDQMIPPHPEGHGSQRWVPASQNAVGLKGKGKRKKGRTKVEEKGQKMEANLNLLDKINIHEDVAVGGDG